MATPTDHPKTAAERLVSTAIESTWLLWLLGALYVAGPALGWALGGLACLSLYIGAQNPNAPPRGPFSRAIILWLFGMTAMLVILWIGHATHELGVGQTVKSSVGWAKGWALIALFLFAGASLGIRSEVISRAVCRLGLQTLLLIPVFLVAPYIGLPEQLWVSPLKVLGGSGPEYFAATLYTLEPGTGAPRWQFFAPWSPAAGMMGVIFVLLAMLEKNARWKAIGLLAGLCLALLSQSRLALVALVVVLPAGWAIVRLNRPSLWLAAAPVILATGILGPTLVELAEAALAEFSAARADSSRVRATLGRIAIERWQNEAFWFGHGIVENGPHLVEYMPIGSHHSWYGLLFVKGLAGVVSLAVPLGVTVAILAAKAYRSEVAQNALCLSLVLVLYSFGENLEILAYLYWPALLVMGQALNTSKPSQSRSQ